MSAIDQLRKGGMQERQLDEPITRRALCEYNELLVAKFSDLTARVKAIEEKGVTYRGIFNLSETYVRGDLVTCGGSIFHACKDTRGIAPAHEGERGSDYSWSLACRRGRDGKDR